MITNSKYLVTIAIALEQAVSAFPNLSDSSRLLEENCVSCDSYSQLSASEKLSLLWSKIEDSKYKQLPEDWMDGSAERPDSFNFIFDRFSDERPPNVPRFFHEYGSVAQVEWVPPAGTSSNFTGLFQGSDYGLIRVSNCAPLITIGVRPPYSFALKMLRSGMYSANLVTCETPTMIDLAEWGADDDYNVFRRTLATSTHLGPSLGKQFSHAQPASTSFLSAAEPALFNQDGEEEPQAVFPPLIMFEPNQELAGSLPGNTDFRLDLAMIKEGTVLYTGYATVDKDGKPHMCACYDTLDGTLPCWTLDQAEEAGCNVVNIGTIKTMSDFLHSDYGDNKLLFKHTRFCESERVTCEGDDPVEGYTNMYPIEGKMDSGAQCISKLVSPELQCPFIRNVKKTPNCSNLLDNTESQCPMLNGIHLSLLTNFDDNYPMEDQVLGECLIDGSKGIQETKMALQQSGDLVTSLGLIPKGCCAALNGYFDNFFGDGDAPIDQKFLCENPTCLPILKAKYPMMDEAPSLCSGPEALVCKNGELRIYMVENEMFGAGKGQCTELCSFPFVLDFLEGEQLGTCEEAGYTNPVDMIEINFNGPIKVALYSKNDASETSSGDMNETSISDTSEPTSSASKAYYGYY